MSRQPEADFLVRILDTVATWQKRSHDRKVLSQMSERQRCDIGLSRETLDDEISKPFWRG